MIGKGKRNVCFFRRRKVLHLSCLAENAVCMPRLIQYIALVIDKDRLELSIMFLVFKAYLRFV